MTENTVLDTRIHEPSMAVDEIDMLVFALERSAHSSPGSAAASTPPL